MQIKNLPFYTAVSLIWLFGINTCHVRAETTLHASDYGVTGDGNANDTAAVHRMLAAAAASEKPATLLFTENSVVYAANADNRYLFYLKALRDVTIDGRGTTFLLHPDIRFMSMQDCTNIVVRNLNINFRPLPFADALVIADSEEEGWIDAQLPRSASAEQFQGAPTKADGEQAFFAMLWNQGPYDLISCHYWTRLIEVLPEPGCLRIHCEKNFKQHSFIEPNTTRVSIPLPGVAHRYGPGGCVDIFDNHNVKLHNIELWSAPWFGFRVFRNSGHLHFNKVNIRPEPNSGNLTSTWRDGFHVKGNRAELLWENCVLEGMNDDAFNISTHSRVITHIFSTQKFKTRQLYPLEPIPWRIGDLMTALDPQTGSIRGSARVISVSAEKSGFNRENAAPFLTIQIDQPIPGLTLEDHLWQPASTNPKTTIKNCIIKQSCRMQSSLTMIGCEVTALLWFYGETIEGPGPQSITLRDCVLRRGRGNPSRALVINGEGINKNSPILLPRLIENATIQNCEIHGGISIKGADAVTLKHNVFAEPNATIELKRNNRLDSAQ